jgi:hypothetical protein
MPQILWCIVYKSTLECHKFSGILCTNLPWNATFSGKLCTNLPWNATNSLVNCVQIYIGMPQILWHIVYKFTLECHKFSGILCINLLWNARNSLVNCV